MNFIYRKAALDDMKILVDTRVEILRDANGHGESLV